MGKVFVVEGARTKAQHVLYIDDDASLIRIGQRLLERFGYEVSGYTNPNEAIEAVRVSPARFDVVVVDQNMPEMFGTAVAQEIAVLRSDLPIILVSGNLPPEEQLAAGTIRHRLGKPFTGEQLSAAIALALDRR